MKNATPSPVRSAIAGNPGLQDALCAISFFRGRHGLRLKFKSGRRREQTTRVNRAEYVAMAREHISQARRAGWRGSVVKVLVEGGAS